MMIEYVVVIVFILIIFIAMMYHSGTPDNKSVDKFVSPVSQKSPEPPAPAPAPPRTKTKKRQRVSFAPVANKRFVDIEEPVGGNATFIKDVRVKV